MFSEETDWLHRFRAAGWKVLFFPGAEVAHVGGASHGGQLSVENLRGILRFLAKHRGVREAERARRLLLWSLRLRGLAFRGERGARYRDGARFLASGDVRVAARVTAALDRRSPAAPFAARVRAACPSGRGLHGHVRFGRSGYPPPAPMRSSLSRNRHVSVTEVRQLRNDSSTGRATARRVERPARVGAGRRERVPAARVRDRRRARAGLARGARARAARGRGDARLGARGRLRRLDGRPSPCTARSRSRSACCSRSAPSRPSLAARRVERAAAAVEHGACSAAACCSGCCSGASSGVVTGDGLFHLARVRKLVELGDLHLRTVDEFADGGLHPGYAFPLWHGFLALVAKVSGLDPTVVMEPRGVAARAARVPRRVRGGRRRLRLGGGRALRARGVARALLLRGRARRVVRDARAAGNGVAAAARAGGVRALLPLGRLAALAGPRRARGRVRRARARAPDLRALRAAAARRLRARARRASGARTGLALAAATVPTVLAFLWLLPLVRDTVSHDPDAVEKARALDALPRPARDRLARQLPARRRTSSAAPARSPSPRSRSCRSRGSPSAAGAGPRSCSAGRCSCWR